MFRPPTAIARSQSLPGGLLAWLTGDLSTGSRMTKTDRVRKLLAAGVSTADIVQVVGCHPAYVRVVRNSRMKLKSRAEAVKEAAARYREALERIPLENRGPSAKAASIYLAGKATMAEAAARCGVSRSAVSFYIKRYNLRETARHV